MRTATVAAVLLVLASCKGADGAAGATGSPGVAGTSITVTSLAVGNANCPHGGTQFTAGTTTSYACNGAPGATGPGSYVWRDATGAFVAPVTELDGGTWLDSNGRAWAWDSMAYVDGEPRWTLRGFVYADFSELDCAGVAYVRAGFLFPGLVVEVGSTSGSSYYAVPDSALPAPSTVTYASSWDWESGVCSNWSGTMSAVPVSALTPITKPTFPFTPPFHVAAQ